MILDIHAHIDFLPEEKLKEIEENKKIKYVVSNSVNLESLKKNIEISKEFKKIKVAGGLYPEDDLTLEKYKEFEEFILKNKKEVVAIGEIGIDKSEKLDFSLQKEIFEKQLKLAEKLKLPVIIHTRKAEKEALEILENYKNKIKVLLHCFSGNFKLIKKGIDLGFYFSIPANVVRSEHFQKVIREIPRERVLTETDSPYLSPFPEKKNEPAFIEESIKIISKIWGTSKKETEKQIEKNFNNLFSP